MVAMNSPLGMPPGTVIGRDFEVVRHLASGAMGSVYIVQQHSTGKQRAMKVMSHELAGNDRARERFVLEARVGAGIESDHVVEVVTAGIDEATGAPYLVMELLKGEELADMIHRTGPLDLSTVNQILKQAGHALEQAHSRGIVHRDIKPENLFIAESRREGVPFTVKILDFGIAKLVAERTAEGTQPVGTPLFMAPEQTDRRAQISPSTDVWPLGLMAFTLLTGKTYWLGAEEGITTLLREVVMEPIAPASQRAQQLGVAARLPRGFDAWFGRCVNRDLSQRFPEAGSCVRAFEEMVRAVITGVGRTMAQPPVIPDAATVPFPGGTSAAAQAVFGTGNAGLSHAGGTGMGTGNVGATGGPGVATGLTAASSMNTEGAAPSSKSGLVIGGLLALVGIGAAGYFATRGGDDEGAAGPSASATATATATASAAAEAAPEGCPEGMALIEAGSMFMGSVDADLDDDVRPPHNVNVATFCLDQNEVTAADYNRCIDDGACLRKPVAVDFPGATDAMKTKLVELCNLDKPDNASHPMNCVDWASANGFCSRAKGRLAEGDGRLPTEAEWEFAARGSGQRTYPWGDEAPGPERLNACGAECDAWLRKHGLKVYGMMYKGDDGFPGTAPVGSFADGASSAGVLDLAGNVWEWTADWYGPYSDADQTDPKGPSEGSERVVRGGGFNGLMPSWAKPAYRFKTAPSTSSHGIGFRCAAAPR
jgi:eukaryotic-like serine/threonine-protein kinase